MIRERSIATSLILTIFTCGIYGIFWFITLTDDAAFASGDKSMSGGTCILLTIITCGIYSFYWNYKMGQLLYQAKLQRNIPAVNNSVLYLILGVFGLGLVGNCLMQDELNNLAVIK